MLIQKLRLQGGWSQEQLADLAGLNIRTIQWIEGGQSASAESLKALAAVFEVDFSTLNTPAKLATAAAETVAPASKGNPDTNPNSLGISHEEALVYRQVQRIKGFYNHAAIYALVISGLLVINLLTAPHRLWFVFPMFGWGIGLSVHALRVFKPNFLLSPDWEKRQIAKRMENLKKGGQS